MSFNLSVILSIHVAAQNMEEIHGLDGLGPKVDGLCSSTSMRIPIRTVEAYPHAKEPMFPCLEVFVFRGLQAWLRHEGYNPILLLGRPKPQVHLRCLQKTLALGQGRH